MYYLFALYNNRKKLTCVRGFAALSRGEKSRKKSRKTSGTRVTIRSNRKCSKVVEISSDILGNVRKSTGNRRKSSEVARTFSEIPLMTRQKSHAFDSEKVGRYTSL